MYGTIVSDWKIERGMLRWHVAVPPGTTATVYVPTKDAESVTESGKPADGVQGVRLLRVECDAAVFAIGSGDYTFLSPWRAPPRHVKESDQISADSGT